ncbi:MAG TPA: hypothetical protein VM936_10275 [Pyrinomonadaceae bacterium]|nr:hypothetical protein [Pyrinomonadaceae bacterium]
MSRLLAVALVLCAASSLCAAQRAKRARASEDAEFGPNVRAYLGYLRDEQEVVDDRASRREIRRDYYVHNSNRIYALRQMAIRIARETNNDYLPELEAVSQTELDQLFEAPPQPAELQVGTTIEYKFKFLGAVAARGERFYLFARLDPYEQAEERKKAAGGAQPGAHAATVNQTAEPSNERPRRVTPP